MGKAAYKLQKAVRQEEADIQAAARKRGLWGSIGSTLGSVLAMAVTGGAAAPLAAGLLAGGLSYAGGKLGSGLAKASGAKIEGKGKFLSGQRSDIARGIEDQIGASAMKTGLMAGMAKLAGGALKYGKDGFSATVGTTAGKVTEAGGEVIGKAAGETAKGGFQFGDIFQGKDVATQKALAGQTGIGKALDFRGSWLGGKMAASKSAQLAQEFSDKGWIDPSLQSDVTGVGMPSGKPIVAMHRAVGEGRQAKLGEFLRGREDLATEFGVGGGASSGLRRMKTQMPIDVAEFTQQRPISSEDMLLDARSKKDYLYESAKNLPPMSKRDFRLEDIERPSMIDVPEFSASEAQNKAIMESVVPSEYGAPRGVTWGETAVDPGTSDISYALPDQGGSYTGDVPSLMDVYEGELGKELPWGADVETLDPNLFSPGDMPMDFDQQIYDVVSTPGTEGVPASTAADLPPRTNLSVQMMERTGQGQQNYGVFNQETGQWEGALGAGRPGVGTRADFLGGETGPYIKRQGDVFADTSGTDYPRVTEYLQSDEYGQYLSDAEIPAIEGTEGTTSLVPTDEISADMETFPGEQTLLQQTQGSERTLPTGMSAHQRAMEDRYYQDIYDVQADKYSTEQGLIGPPEASIPYDSEVAMDKRYGRSTSFSPQYDFVKPTGQGSRDLQQSLRWQDRFWPTKNRFGR